MEKEWNTINLLRHSRHDWLNRIQLIKGYLALGDSEKVNQLIDSFVQESNKETAISNLEMDTFVSYILTFNWENHPIMLDYEVEGTVRKLSKYDMEMYDFTQAFFTELAQHVEMFSENQMEITIEINEDDICFYFDFRGKLKGHENMKQWIKDYSKWQHVSVSHLHVTEEEMTVTIS